jgi:hypothetical protein
MHGRFLPLKNAVVGDIPKIVTDDGSPDAGIFA